VPGILAAAIDGLILPLFALIFAQILGAFFVVNSSELLASAAVYCGGFAGLAVVNGLSTFFANYIFGRSRFDIYSGFRSISVLFSHVEHNFSLVPFIIIRTVPDI
jgi:hypothetical protein